MQLETRLIWRLLLEYSLLVFGGIGSIRKMGTGVNIDNNKLFNK